MSFSGRYALAKGEIGARRLAILDEIQWPSSRALLRRAGLRRGMSFLDVGCGIGALTHRVAALGIDAHGVDQDPGFVARAQAKQSPAAFQVLEVQRLAEHGHRFDVVYARYLLSHLSDPLAAIHAMKSVAKPGGVLVVEDIDIATHIAEPRPVAMDGYIEVYSAVIRKRGADPTLGKRLFHLTHEAGLHSPRASVQLTALHGTMAKQLSSLTLLGIWEAAIAENIASESELEEILRGLQTLESNPRSVITAAATHQVFGRV